ncbi:MAG TPA: 16S rRNA (adenine(1518)-N(6)/adenine(1519)-N(6))-dimethyltransferase RsmA [Puia sp.]|jgi:16S rRNA (adenine1518-N6/adenine1519-N6)-dimethyltransferase|nr:16S rRNA (adenine(1518)-N(6)/adenine(1519)-N(6))-dimethyltransferase RsmA [Puia sp.]
MTYLSRPLNLKKSLGQHFLKDELVCKQIIDSLKQFPFKQLLEIGPGAGALTRNLISLEGVDFKAVEIDREKVGYLQKKYPSLINRIIEMDFLQMGKPFEGRFTIIGNFPYNISTEILFKVLDWREDVERLIGMFQKEVAQRITASEGNKIYGVTSVLLQAFFNVEYLFEVSEQAFIPPPKVKSAVIRLTPKKEPASVRTEKMFFLLVKTAFNQRRKTLRNAVKSLFSEEVLKDSIFNKRAEQLTILQFAELTWKMK